MKRLFKITISFILISFLLASGVLAAYGNFSTFNINTTTSVGALTNYPVLFTLSNATGVSASGIIYTNGTTRSDWNDVQFTDNTGTNVSFWLNYNKTTSTTIQAFSNYSISSSGSTGRFYFGSPTSTTSNQNPTPTLYQFHGASTITFNDSVVVPYYNVSFYGETRVTNAGDYAVWGLVGSNGSADAMQMQSYNAGSVEYGYSNGNGITTAINEAPAQTVNAWTIVIMNVSKTYANYTRNGNEIANGMSTPIYLPKNNLGLTQTMGIGGQQNYSYARQWVPIEPTISFISGAPVASFTADITSGTTPLAVQFNDTSTNIPTSWNWSFQNVTGNNTQVWWSTTQNPALSFGVGNFSIKLNATNGGGSNISTQSTFVNVSASPSPPISASFTQSPNPSNVGQAVTYTDTSTGTPTTWSWTLIGTTPTNTTQNAGYTYSTAGTYNIFLNVTNATGSWSNTSQTHTVVNASGFTPRDIWMEARYTETFHITDSSTGLPIATVTLTDTAGATNTTIAGTGTLTEGFGPSTVTFVAAGYDSRAISYFFDSDATWDVQLTASSPATIKQQSIWYTPKQISITVVSYYPSGQKIPGAHIELRAIGNSLQADSQLQTIYGINPEAANQMLNGTLIMNSTTDMTGVAVFTVLASINYVATVTDPSTGRLWTTNINPGLDPYTIWIGDKPNVVNTTEIDSLNQTRLWASQPDFGNWTLNMQYRDLTGKTTDVRFIVKAAGNLTEVYNVSLGNPGTSLVLANHTHKNIIGEGYYYYWKATRV